MFVKDDQSICADFLFFFLQQQYNVINVPIKITPNGIVTPRIIFNDLVSSGAGSTYPNLSKNPFEVNDVT